MSGQLDTRCHFCGEPIDPSSPTTWLGSHGWARVAGVRASGKHGGSDITLRSTVPGEFAHNACIVRAKSGIAAGQEALL